ncbi:MAG: hypothetical protein ACO2ZM_00510 [Francisellaceae bacterium]
MKLVKRILLAFPIYACMGYGSPFIDANNVGEYASHQLRQSVATGKTLLGAASGSDTAIANGQSGDSYSFSSNLLTLSATHGFSQFNVGYYYSGISNYFQALPVYYDDQDAKKSYFGIDDDQFVYYYPEYFAFNNGNDNPYIFHLMKSDDYSQHFTQGNITGLPFYHHYNGLEKIEIDGMSLILNGLYDQTTAGTIITIQSPNSAKSRYIVGWNTLTYEDKSLGKFLTIRDQIGQRIYYLSKDNEVSGYDVYTVAYLQDRNGNLIHVLYNADHSIEFYALLDNALLGRLAYTATEKGIYPANSLIGSVYTEKGQTLSASRYILFQSAPVKTGAIAEIFDKVKPDQVNDDTMPRFVKGMGLTYSYSSNFPYQVATLLDPTHAEVTQTISYTDLKDSDGNVYNRVISQISGIDDKVTADISYTKYSSSQYAFKPLILDVKDDKKDERYVEEEIKNIDAVNNNQFDYYPSQFLYSKDGKSIKKTEVYYSAASSELSIATLSDLGYRINDKNIKDFITDDLGINYDSVKALSYEDFYNRIPMLNSDFIADVQAYDGFATPTIPNNYYADPSLYTGMHIDSSALTRFDDTPYANAYENLLFENEYPYSAMFGSNVYLFGRIGAAATVYPYDATSNIRSFSCTATVTGAPECGNVSSLADKQQYLTDSRELSFYHHYGYENVTIFDALGRIIVKAVYLIHTGSNEVPSSAVTSANIERNLLLKVNYSYQTPASRVFHAFGYTSYNDSIPRYADLGAAYDKPTIVTSTVYGDILAGAYKPYTSPIVKQMSYSYTESGNIAKVIYDNGASEEMSYQTPSSSILYSIIRKYSELPTSIKPFISTIKSTTTSFGVDNDYLFPKVREIDNEINTASSIILAPSKTISYYPQADGSVIAGLVKSITDNEITNKDGLPSSGGDIISFSSLNTLKPSDDGNDLIAQQTSMTGISTISGKASLTAGTTSYNGMGYPVKNTDIYGNTLSYGYDMTGALTKQTYTPASSAFDTQESTIQYDRDVATDRETITSTDDKGNRIISIYELSTGLLLSQSINYKDHDEVPVASYSYNEDGSLHSQTNYSGQQADGSNAAITTVYGYNDLGQVISAEPDVGIASGIVYDPYHGITVDFSYTKNPENADQIKLIGVLSVNRIDPITGLNVEQAVYNSDIFGNGYIQKSDLFGENAFSIIGVLFNQKYAGLPAVLAQAIFDDPGMDYLNTTTPDIISHGSERYDNLSRLYQTIVNEYQDDVKGPDLITTYDYSHVADQDEMSITDPQGRIFTTKTNMLGQEMYSQISLKQNASIKNYYLSQSQHDGLGRTTNHISNTANDLTQLNHFSADQETKYVYNENGSLQSVTDPMGNQTTFGYDAIGNVTEQTIGNQYKNQYHYNADGSLSNLIGTGISESFNYDAAGMLADESISNEAFGNKVFHILNRDDYGNITHWDNPFLPTTSAGAANFSVTFDQYGRLSSRTLTGLSSSPGDGYIENYRYNDKGQLYSVTSKNILFDNNPHLPDYIQGYVDFDYNNLGQIIQMSKSYENNNQTPGTHPVYMTEQLSYLNNGNISEKSLSIDQLQDDTNRKHSFDSKQTDSYQYDPISGYVISHKTLLQRKNSISDYTTLKTQTDQFSYDLLGNILSDHTNNVTRDYSYYENNPFRLKRISNRSLNDMTYDNNGNVIADDMGQLYQRNAMSQITSVTDGLMNAAPVYYDYDSLGHQISETQGNQTLSSFYVGNTLMAKRDINATTSMNTPYGNLAINPDNSVSEQLVLHDLLGNPVFSTPIEKVNEDYSIREIGIIDNAKTLPVFDYFKNREDYDVSNFKPQPSTLSILGFDPAKGLSDMFEFGLDNENGAAYDPFLKNTISMGATFNRKYDSGTGRFMDADTIGGVNPYMAMNNDLINNTDPSGHYSQHNPNYQFSNPANYEHIHKPSHGSCGFFCKLFTDDPVDGAISDAGKDVWSWFSHNGAGIVKGSDFTKPIAQFASGGHWGGDPEYNLHQLSIGDTLTSDLDFAMSVTGLVMPVEDEVGTTIEEDLDKKIIQDVRPKNDDSNLDNLGLKRTNKRQSRSEKKEYQKKLARRNSRRVMQNISTAQFDEKAKEFWRITEFANLADEAANPYTLMATATKIMDASKYSGDYSLIVSHGQVSKSGIASLTFRISEGKHVTMSEYIDDDISTEIGLNHIFKLSRANEHNPLCLIACRSIQNAKMVAKVTGRDVYTLATEDVAAISTDLSDIFAVRFYSGASQGNLKPLDEGARVQPDGTVSTFPITW